MKRLLILLTVFLAVVATARSQAVPKKELTAFKTADKPRIDGALSDTCWMAAEMATGFVQYEPYNGAKPSFQTQVRVAYDDHALYIAAVLHDDEPDKIMRELGPRDSDNLNADLFVVNISPYNDGLNSFDFFLYASGVQTDIKSFATGEDASWDAVWKSETKITPEGWVAEIEIPWSALRFPKSDKQRWGINFVREIRRFREISTWNFIDKKVDGFINQAGVLNGIEDIRPPLRLSFEPYLSASMAREPSQTSWDYRLNGGMDLKYGINESFTLDMTLIPDFSQVPSDDEVVNLGPFETYYSEKRQFFTEGVELFSRGDIFYSRRIGTEPMHYHDIEDNYPPDDILENPGQTRLLNATKLSGRTAGGTGLGLFNAFTAASYATVRDSAGNETDIMTQPFTNYNMLVADQSLPNKSYISLYNTNVYRGKNEYTANVTGTEMQFRDRKNRVAASGLFNVSQKYFPSDKPETGFIYEIELEKISGNARYGIAQKVISDTYDPNDLGYLAMNNEFENEAYFSYDVYEPAGILRDMHTEISVEYNRLYNPGEFTSFEISLENRTQFRNKLTVGLFADILPVESHDYFEPRNKGWYVTEPPFYSIRGYYSPDYNKTFLVDVMPGISWGSDYDQLGYSLRLSPRYKVNDHLFIVLSAQFSRNLNNIGYVTDSLSCCGLAIIFGKRDIENITTTLTVNYAINPRFNFSGRLRHYYFKAAYDQYYDLKWDGSLEPNSYDRDHSFLYNSFNIDAYFTWLFAPGSELALAWKNAVYARKPLPSEGYFRELGNTLDSPASNLVSIRILYYLDYQYLKRIRAKT